MYLLWSTKLSGWFTASGTYSSDRADAKFFDHTAMLQACRRQMNNGMSEFGFLPVSLDTLLEVVE